MILRHLARSVYLSNLKRVSSLMRFARIIFSSKLIDLVGLSHRRTVFLACALWNLKKKTEILGRCFARKMYVYCCFQITYNV